MDRASQIRRLLGLLGHDFEPRRTELDAQLAHARTQELARAAAEAGMRSVFAQFPPPGRSAAAASVAAGNVDADPTAPPTLQIVGQLTLAVIDSELQQQLLKAMESLTSSDFVSALARMPSAAPVAPNAPDATSDDAAEKSREAAESASIAPAPTPAAPVATASASPAHDKTPEFPLHLLLEDFLVPAAGSVPGVFDTEQDFAHAADDVPPTDRLKQWQDNRAFYGAALAGLVWRVPQYGGVSGAGPAYMKVVLRALAVEEAKDRTALTALRDILLAPAQADVQTESADAEDAASLAFFGAEKGKGVYPFRNTVDPDVRARGALYFASALAKLRSGRNPKPSLRTLLRSPALIRDLMPGVVSTGTQTEWLDPIEFNTAMAQMQQDAEALEAALQQHRAPWAVSALHLGPSFRRMQDPLPASASAGAVFKDVPVQHYSSVPGISSGEVFDSVRLIAIRRAFTHAFGAYLSVADGQDILHPLTRTGSEDLCKMGMTLIDSIGTLLIMNVPQAYEHVRKWVDEQLPFMLGNGKQENINLFETTIRIIGGLLSAYDLTGDAMYAERASQVMAAMVAAGPFKTASGIPYGTVSIYRRESIGRGVYKHPGALNLPGAGISETWGNAWNPTWLQGVSSSSEALTLSVEMITLAKALREVQSHGGLRANRTAAPSLEEIAAEHPGGLPAPAAPSAEWYLGAARKIMSRVAQQVTMDPVITVEEEEANEEESIVLSQESPSFFSFGRATPTPTPALSPRDRQIRDGLLPIHISPVTGEFQRDSPITLGARGDSSYEYLLKTWIAEGGWGFEEKRAELAAAYSLARAVQRRFSEETRNVRGRNNQRPDTLRKVDESLVRATDRARQAYDAVIAAFHRVYRADGSFTVESNPHPNPRYLLTLYNKAVAGISKHLIGWSDPLEYMFVNEIYGNSTKVPKMDHLACFLPGLIALGATHAAGHEVLSQWKESRVRRIAASRVVNGYMNRISAHMAAGTVVRSEHIVSSTNIRAGVLPPTAVIVGQRVWANVSLTTQSLLDDLSLSFGDLSMDLMDRHLSASQMSAFSDTLSHLAGAWRRELMSDVVHDMAKLIQVTEAGYGVPEDFALESELQNGHCGAKPTGAFDCGTIAPPYHPGGAHPVDKRDPSWWIGRLEWASDVFIRRRATITDAFLAQRSKKGKEEIASVSVNAADSAEALRLSQLEPVENEQLSYIHYKAAIQNHYAPGQTERATLTKLAKTFASSAWIVLNDPDEAASILMAVGHMLTRTCITMYERTTTGLAPEIVTARSRRDLVPNDDAKHSILRPETVESLFIMHRVTNGLVPSFRTWGWEIFDSLERHAKVREGGYASVKDVMARPFVAETFSFGKANMQDKMESFFLAETMKYLYLLFTDYDHSQMKIYAGTPYVLRCSKPPQGFTTQNADQTRCYTAPAVPEHISIPLDSWVFNTEAHPVRIRRVEMQ
jgi:hypothetical protein